MIEFTLAHPPVLQLGKHPHSPEALPSPAAPFVTSFPAVWALSILEKTGRRENIKRWSG